MMDVTFSWDEPATTADEFIGSSKPTPLQNQSEQDTKAVSVASDEFREAKVSPTDIILNQKRLEDDEELDPVESIETAIDLPVQEGAPAPAPVEQPVSNKTETMLKQDKDVDTEDFVSRVQSAFADKSLKLTEDELKNDQTWKEANAILKSYLGDQGYRGDAYGMSIGSEMFGNLAGGVNIQGTTRAFGGMAPIVAKVLQSDDPKVLNAMLYNLEMYERKPMSIRGWQEGTKHALTDFSNYVGLGLLMQAGGKTLGKYGTSRVAKNAIISKLTPTAVTATGMAEGAIFTVADEYMRQMIQRDAGVQDEFDITNLALAGGLGALAGGTLVKGVPYLVKIPSAIAKSSKKTYEYIMKGLEKEANGEKFFEKAKQVDPDGNPIFGNAGGGVPPQQHQTKRTATLEATPSSKAPYYETIKAMTPDERIAFETAHIKPVEDLMSEFGIKGKVLISKGAWDGQTNPNMLIEFDDNVNTKDIDNFMAKFGEDTEQDAVAWYKPKFTEGGEQNHLAIGITGEVTDAEWAKFYGALREEVSDNLTPILRDGEIHIMNYGDADGKVLSVDDMRTAVNNALSKTKELDAKITGTVDMFSAESNYIGADDYANYRNKTNNERQSDIQTKSGRDDGFKAEVRKIRTNAKVAPTLREAESLSGKALNKKLNTINVGDLTPENKQKYINFRQSQKKKAPPKPKKVQKAIKVNEDFNENIYSLVENEILHLDKNKVYTPKELEKIFANATDNEMQGSGIKDMIDSNPDGLTGGALQDAISARPDKLNKVVLDSETNPRTLDKDEWMDEYYEEGDWENAPNWVSYESAMAYRVRDVSYGEDNYIKQVFDDDAYVDVDGDFVGDYNGMRTKWYDDDMDIADYADTIKDAIPEGDVPDIGVEIQNLLDREIDNIDRIIAKNTDGDVTNYKKTRDELEAMSSDFDKAYDNNTEQEWIDKTYETHPEYVVEGARKDTTVKEAVLDEADGEWYAYYNEEVKYERENGGRFDTLEEALGDLQDDMYIDYEARMTDEAYGGVDIHEGYTIDGGKDYEVGIFEMPNMKHAPDKEVYTEGHWGGTEQGGKNVTVHTRKKTRTDNDGSEGIVSEEIQSQARQTFDETGGRGKKFSEKEQAKIQTQIDDKIEKQNQASIDFNEANDDFMELKKVSDPYIRDLKVKLKPARMDEINETLITQYKDREVVRKETVAKYSQVGEDYSNVKTIMDEYDAKVDYNNVREKLSDEHDALSIKLRTDIEADPKYIELESQRRKILDDRNLADRDFNVRKAQVTELTKKKRGKEPSPYNEPPMESQNYEKMVTYDNIMNAVDNDMSFYGSNNGQTSNGNDVSMGAEIGGMVNSYNHSIPKIMEEITGERPYVAYYSGMQSDPANRKYWVPQKDVPQTLRTKKDKPLSNYSELYNESPKDWYWRIDLTDEVKAKLKDSKMPLYGIGAGIILGNQQDDNKEQ